MYVFHQLSFPIPPHEPVPISDGGTETLLIPEHLQDQRHARRHTVNVISTSCLLIIVSRRLSLLLIFSAQGQLTIRQDEKVSINIGHFPRLSMRNRTISEWLSYPYSLQTDSAHLHFKHWLMVTRMKVVNSSPCIYFASHRWQRYNSIQLWRIILLF